MNRLLPCLIVSLALSCGVKKQDDPQTKVSCDLSLDAVPSRDARLDHAQLELLDSFDVEKSYDRLQPTDEEWEITDGKLTVADKVYELSYWDSDFSWTVIDESRNSVGSLRAFVAPDCGEYRYFQLDLAEGARSGRLLLNFVTL